ncbi:MAG: hypothetical protein HRU19_17280 [Pseudobacteriovorax sp.]|nr:hypothetical protein [Pseudobacteriovorax sp.]
MKSFFVPDKLISRKKLTYTVTEAFDKYLRHFNRGILLSLDYDELLRYEDCFPLYDHNGNDTLWVTVSFQAQEHKELSYKLLQIYAFLRSNGQMDVLSHLRVDRIDLCLYGNTKPFRIRIINSINDNFDYFYIKQADASRVFGLELEHILSPNRIGFMFHQNTIIEEHIYGIPGDVFLENYLGKSDVNKVRLAKEFVKFNERCFLRLLGDMHSSNFVVDITMDFEENFYRLRAIDFDQQSYEPRKKIYLPQFFPQNRGYVQLAMDYLTPESIRQYQKEERSLIRQRIYSSSYRLSRLLEVFADTEIAPEDSVRQLAEELSEHYKESGFLNCRTMGQLVAQSLLMVETSPPHI